MEQELILKMVLIPGATWRLYRLFATDTGPKKILRRFRIKLGVKYKGNDYADYTTEDGSLAEMITCPKCSTVWLGGILTLLLLFVPGWIYYLAVLPFNASGLALIFENLVYRPAEWGEKPAGKKKDELDKRHPCF